MLFSLKILFFFSSVMLKLHALTPDQKASLDQMKEKAKAYQESAEILHQEAVKRVRKQGNPLTEKTESGSCPIGHCGLTGSKVISLNADKEAEPYLLQDKKPLVFVSASMPLAALKHLGKQAQQKGARLVIKGFVKGTLKETAHLVDDIGCPLEIDPKLFENFKVTQVPTILVYEKGGWHKVKGNLEIGFAQELAFQKGKGTAP